jgi:hypothetical protein
MLGLGVGEIVAPACAGPCCAGLGVAAQPATMPVRSSVHRPMMHREIVFNPAGRPLSRMAFIRRDLSALEMGQRTDGLDEHVDMVVSHAPIVTGAVPADLAADGSKHHADRGAHPTACQEVDHQGFARKALQQHEVPWGHQLLISRECPHFDVGDGRSTRPASSSSSERGISEGRSLRRLGGGAVPIAPGDRKASRQPDLGQFAGHSCELAA